MNNHQPFFSIITASLNNAKTIEKTIVSIKNQQFQSFEHIIVDGASTDGTMDILKKFENRYLLRWICEPDNGIADALNKGIEISRGKYILVIQADDTLWDDMRLAISADALFDERWDIFSHPVWVDGPGNGYLFKPKRLLWYIHFKTIFPHQGCFVHRRVFRGIGGFNTDYKVAMDYDFFYRAIQSGVCVKFGSAPLAVMSGTGISSKRIWLKTRIQEEFEVQRTNETSVWWGIAVLFFRILYYPYKIHLLPLMERRFHDVKKSKNL